ncbi:PREDICTED: platelet-activating factor acetylhydrolase IB subunit gamma [Mandrillus leucophaeus]|uniref:Platelet-activating factor acetylhydrolase IB subunit alpha1 n=1 Tax=Mandrillus leucophaeus TaxID=9568 RepID=A0A2K5XK76_MANLE|nr:PREDICTED: platelet-activating factor acetylhydrolase IB subunit gamma [Mandrillus leucophaeus]
MRLEGSGVPERDSGRRNPGVYELGRRCLREQGGVGPGACVPLTPSRALPQHHRFVADSKDKEPEVVFIGDSLVQLMHQCEIWRELFSPLHALNFGIGGDGTQHVLWRLENGELEHIRPKIVVVWVGTNNHGHTAEQVTGGIKAIVQLVNERQPQARVVVLGLLPRGQHPNPLREKNRRVNELVRAALAGHPRAHFLDADPGFVHSDGTISHHDMYDYLHLSRLGYTPVCRALHSLLLRLLAQDQGQGAPLLEPAP